jgi:hypothetical protein
MILKNLIDARPPGDAAIFASGRTGLAYGLFASLCEETLLALRALGPVPRSAFQHFSFFPSDL